MRTRPVLLLLLTLWRIVGGIGLSASRSDVGKPRPPRTVFVAVMSARGSEAKRNGSRPLWHRVEKEGHATARYVICNDTSHDDDPAAVAQALEAEQARFRDLVFLSCEEGYSHGRLTLKVLASMQYFHRQPAPMDLFMKVDDDAFVAWSRLYQHVNELKQVSMKYIGHPLGPCNATRDPENRWYEPPEVYPNESYPKTMAGGVGYLVGSGLIREILVDKQKERNSDLLWNEDRATAVWIEKVASRNPSVKTVGFKAYPYTMRCDSTWGAYPFWAQGSLSGDAITCLSEADAANQSDFDIRGCFSEDCRSGPDWVSWDNYSNRTLDQPTGCHILNNSAMKGVVSPPRC